MKITDPYKIILLTPLIFVLHVAEEFPSFVNWVNGIISDGITQNMFLVVNITGFVITIFLSIFMAISKDEIAVILNLAWLSFLMFANGLFHLLATVAYGYSPGVVTSIVLYLPYFVWFVWSLISKKTLSSMTIGITIAIGSLPMFLHGYMIIFEGRTLF